MSGSTSAAPAAASSATETTATDKHVPSIIYDIAGAVAPPVCPRVLDCSSASPKTTFQLPKGMTPLKFYREFVATSTPVVFKNAASHLPAIKKWTRKYLVEQLEHRTKLKVSLTPQGWADAIVDVDIDDDADEGDAKGDGDKKKTTKKTRMFMSPAEQRMKCSEFFQMLDRCRHQHNQRGEKEKTGTATQQPNGRTDQKEPIVYMQAQDGCLMSESFRGLVHDLLDCEDDDGEDYDADDDADETTDDEAAKQQDPKTEATPEDDDEEEEEEEHPEEEKILQRRNSIVKFGTEVFGSPPDASNIWFGCAASTTSMHQDYTENLYVQIRGTKLFTLVAPTDCFAVPKKAIPEGRYEYDATKNEFSVHEETDEGLGMDNSFIWVDFNEVEAVKKGARVYHVALEPGDFLYLPHSWYHEVGQQEDNSEKTQDDDDRFVCAVNFWYNLMEFGHKFELQRLMKHVLGHPDTD